MTTSGSWHEATAPSLEGPPSAGLNRLGGEGGLAGHRHSQKIVELCIDVVPEGHFHVRRLQPQTEASLRGVSGVVVAQDQGGRFGQRNLQVLPCFGLENGPDEMAIG